MDFDGTIAHHGIVSAETRGALARFKQTGRKLILVTGRNLPDLKRVFPELQLFDRVVAENGALIYDPATNEERPLAAAPPSLFVEKLKERTERYCVVLQTLLAPPPIEARWSVAPD